MMKTLEERSRKQQALREEERQESRLLLLVLGALGRWVCRRL
jgi:hypothetical protein